LGSSRSDLAANGYEQVLVGIEGFAELLATSAWADWSEAARLDRFEMSYRSHLERRQARRTAA
jgi:hypothetical protein